MNTCCRRLCYNTVNMDVCFIMKRNGGKGEIMKRVRTWTMAGILAITLTGCASSPEKSVVQEKNMEKMLEQAESKEDTSSYEQVKEELKKKYETYQTQIKDKKLKVTVDVDAKVEVPEVEKLSVYRVSPKKISQSFLDKVRKTLTPDITYYDGRKKDARTKSVVAKEIAGVERWLAEAKKSKDTAMVEEYKEELVELKKEYKSVPDQVVLTDYPSDNKIQSIKKLYDSDPNDTFYSWLHELHGNGDVFYGVSDRKEGTQCELFVQNSENYGNCLRYECGKNGRASHIHGADVGSDIPYTVPKKKGQEPDFTKSGIESEKGQPFTATCVDNEPLTLSEKEAEKKVMILMGQLGLNDYQCYEKGLCSQLVSGMDEGEAFKYRDVYRFTFLRKLDHVFVNNLTGFKYSDGWQGTEYVKKMWENETVVVTVNNSGIADFYYLSPLTINKTVVEKSRIKSFDEIRDTFEKMVVVENAIKESKDEQDAKVSIKVTDVKLVYSRISEKDSFDTGLIVPVWNFEGTTLDEFGDERTGTILSINAIDGSVINQELGY